MLSLWDPRFPNPFLTHTAPPRLTGNDRCLQSCLFQGTAGSRGPTGWAQSPKLEGGGSALGPCRSPIPLPRSTCFPPTYASHTHSPVFSSSAFFVPVSQPRLFPSAACTFSLDPAARIQAGPVLATPPCSPSMSLSVSPSEELMLLPHACILWGLQRAPALQFKVTNIYRLPILPPAWCWELGRQQIHRSPSLWS